VINGLAGVSAAAIREYGDASRRALTERTAPRWPERVRALGRASRSAMGSGWSRCARASASLARRRPHSGRRLPEARLRLDGGGPKLLKEDRQKPRRRLEGMHGTRNTVPSRAARPGAERRGAGLEPPVGPIADP
jgi:hypothetical protein